MSSSEALVEHKVPFANPFQIEDLQVFDDDTLRTMLASGSFGLTIEQLAHSMRGASNSLVKRIRHNLSPQQRADFMREFRRSILKCEVDRARRTVLDTLFWELTYWKTPELYEELTQGEYLHPGIFEHLEADIRGKLVLDVGAGSGRASFECKRYGARKIYAVEPSPGLLRILEHKLATRDRDNRIVTYAGRFEDIPLPDNSVDCALSCSAFTSSPGQGGEPGLAELWRVTKNGGKIILIWPCPEDRSWLIAHGFQHVILPLHHEMYVRFRSLCTAIQCVRRFYAHKSDAMRYILTRHSTEIPFSVLGMNPPRDYCELRVRKV